MSFLARSVGNALSGVACCVFVAGCSHASRDGVLTAEYKADVCTRANQCMFLGAAGATIEVFKDGVRWRQVTADDAGRISLRVPEGTYFTQAALPALHWRSSQSAPVDITRGGGGDISGVLPLRRIG